MVMKRTQLLEMIRGFKKQFVVFISIVLFVGFGMGAFLGLTWCSDSLQKTVSEYFADGNLADLEITYTYALSEDDLDFISDLSDYTTVEGRYESYRFLEKDGSRFQIRIASLTDSLNTVTWLEGNLPVNNDEIAVEKSFADKNDIRVGDEIRFTGDDTDNLFQAQLRDGSFRVTGIVKTAEYLSTFADTYGVDPGTGCAVSGIMFAAKDAFASESGGYAGALVKNNRTKGLSVFSEEYRQTENEIKAASETALKDHFSKKYEMLSQIPGLSNLKNYEFGFVSVMANASYAGVDVLTKVFGELRYSLCGLFVIVGVLVCFFAVSRNVFEQTKLLGTKKALGFYNHEMYAALLLFSALAVLIGILMGFAGARYGVAAVLMDAMKETYAFNETRYSINVAQGLVFGAAEMGSILLTTYLASRSVLKRSANSLLIDAREDACIHRRYMDTKFFRRLTEFGKAILNNLFSDRGRVLATIVGIMGITALVVSSVSLNNFIQGSFPKNVEEITKYDTVIYLKGNDKDTEMIKEHLKENEIVFSEIMSTYVTLNTPDDQRLASSLYVVEDEQSFLKLFDLHRENEKLETIRGLYSSISYQDEYKPGQEDTVLLTDAFGQERKFGNVTFFDYYLIQNQFIIDKSSYEASFGETYQTNTILCKRGDIPFCEFQDGFGGYDGIVSISDFYKVSRESFDSFASVFTLVVGVYILLAVLLALVVVMNLLVMLINEKKLELIVLMINGFERRRVKKYIYTDTIVLTVIGTLCGLILGLMIGNISLKAYCTATIYFKGGFNAAACLVGIGITFFLTFLVSVISLRKVDCLTLSDINKL